jgi:hypothetical protein
MASQVQNKMASYTNDQKQNFLWGNLVLSDKISMSKLFDLFVICVQENI